MQSQFKPNSPTFIKKIKAPIGDENINCLNCLKNLLTIKKIKAPIGDENS